MWKPQVVSGSRGGEVPGRKELLSLVHLPQGGGFSRETATPVLTEGQTKSGTDTQSLDGPLLGSVASRPILAKVANLKVAFPVRFGKAWPFTPKVSGLQSRVACGAVDMMGEP